MAHGRHQTYCKYNGFHGSRRSSVSASSLTTIPTFCLTTVSARAKGHEYSNSSAPEKGKKRTSSFPAVGTQTKKQKKVEKDTALRKKLTYEKTAEELEEDTAQYIKEQLKPKVPSKREPVPLDVAKKILANLDNPPKPKSLPSDYDQTLIKAHKQRN